VPLDITEYNQLASDGRGNPVPTGLEPSRRVQQLTIGASSSSSEPLDGVTCFIRVHTDATCRIKFSKTGEAADATCHRLPAGATEFYGVPPGSGIVVSAIQSA
jgi:hypothetical protein